MSKRMKNISKLLLVTGCAVLMTSAAANAAPLTYDVNQPAVRTDYTAPNKIKIEGNVNFNTNMAGQKISLSLRDTDVQQVLRMFADKAGLNIVFHQSAKGTITLDLVDVNLEDAFKMIMKMTNLTYVIKGKTMLVAGTSDAEKLNLTKDNITIIPVKYTDAAYIANFLNTNIFSLNAPGLSYGPIVSTNSDKNELLIFGTDSDVQMAKKIIDKFDKKPVMTTYRVNHTTPFEMAKMICETLFQLPVTGNIANSSAGAPFRANLNSNFKMQTGLNQATSDNAIGGGTIACTLSSSISTDNLSSFQSKPTLVVYVQPELGTLTLVGGSEQQIQMVNDFIMDNDRKQPQAFLEISIISLDEKGQKDFNNDWTYTGKHVNLSFTGADGKLSTGSGIMWHGPSSGSSAHTLHQTINYLISNGKARMLANPKIVITNGKTSTIDLTQDYIESTTVQFVSSSYSSSTTNNMYAQKTYEIGEDNGIKIEVTPFISPDGYVSLNIKPDYSSVLDHITDKFEGSEPYTAATLLQRHNMDLKNVRIKDEETLVLGGMIQTSENNKVYKIPILGDIPIIGFLFRGQSKAMEKSELLFIITPRIIKDTEDIAEL